MKSALAVAAAVLLTALGGCVVVPAEPVGYGYGPPVHGSIVIERSYGGHHGPHRRYRHRH